MAPKTAQEKREEKKRQSGNKCLSPLPKQVPVCSLSLFIGGMW